MDSILLEWIQTTASTHGGFFAILASFIVPFWGKLKAYVKEVQQYRVDQMTHEKEMIELLRDIKGLLRKD